MKSFIGALLFLGALTAAAAGDCPAGRYDDRGVVAHVFDGDTLELADGRRVRLLGIDTPEIGHEERPPQPLAEAARRRLETLAGPGTILHFRFDLERRDRYDRVLAHAYLSDSTNLQAALLDVGLAVTLVVPPNGWNHRCYARIEDAARRSGRGVWSLERYRPVPAAALSRDRRGFVIVTGQVMRIGEGRRNVWLNLAPKVALRIPKTDLGYFEGRSLQPLLGRRVEARGYVERRRGELRITVRHPAALKQLD